MNATTDTTATSYRQTFRRHRLLLSAPVVLGVIVAAYLLFSSHPSYQSTASLWVDTAPPVASSSGASAVPLPATPATAEQGVLTELLTTRAFAVAVAQNSLLGKYLGPSLNRRAGVALQGHQVGATVAGAQLLQISYKGPTRAVAMSTLGAIIKQLQLNSAGLSAQHDQAALSYYKAQVQSASRALTTARNAVLAYLSANPHASPVTDPNLTALTSGENAASTSLAQANTSLSQASGTRNGAGWLVQVVDPPSPAISTSLGKKKMLEILLGGLLGGALISFLGAVALTPGRSEPWEDERPMGRLSGTATGGPTAFTGQTGDWFTELLPAYRPVASDTFPDEPSMATTAPQP